MGAANKLNKDQINILKSVDLILMSDYDRSKSIDFYTDFLRASPPNGT